MIGLKSGIYWMMIGLLMILFFTLTGAPVIQTIYFIAFFLPVIIVTSHYFNNHLIPKYITTGQYWLFLKYTIYTIIFALYAQAIILFLSLLLFTNYQTDQLNGLGIDLLSLGMGTLIVILVNAFYHSIVTLKSQRKTIENLKKELVLNERTTLAIRANRKIYNIPLDQLLIIESRGDYVQLHTSSETITTKERISNLETKLPGHFVRTHRSFIVNRNLIQSHGKNMINIGDREIPISRTYKASVMQRLEL